MKITFNIPVFFFKYIPYLSLIKQTRLHLNESIHDIFHRVIAQNSYVQKVIFREFCVSTICHLANALNRSNHSPENIQNYSAV